jgi:alkylated DNA repair dioxygenase AlkB
MIRYDDHAVFQIARRSIEKAWVEAVLRDPDTVETTGTRRSFFKCLPGRHVMLRVVTPIQDHEYVITAYFDRTRPCV